MSHRRVFAAIAIAASCALLPMTSQAATRGGRHETFSVRTTEPRSVSTFLWQLLTAVWQEAGVRIDNNGGE